MNYDAETLDFVNHGLTVYNSAMLGESEDEHVYRLAELIGLMRLPTQSVVVDVGCGVGGTIERMRKLRPDVEFMGATNCLEQIKHLQRKGITAVYTDLDDPVFPSADMFLFTESIGHGKDLTAILHECAKKLNPNGVIAVKDFCGKDEVVAQSWGYTFVTEEAFKQAAVDSGLTVTCSIPLDCSSDRYVDYWSKSSYMLKAHGSPLPLPITAHLYLMRHNIATDYHPEWFGGNVHAAALVADLCFVAHVWDDLVDGDKPCSPEQTNKAFRVAMVDIPRNAFYQAHFVHLQPLIHAGIWGYITANEMEKSHVEHQVEIAHGLRYSIAQVVAYSVIATNPEDVALSILPEVWQTFMPERFEDYRKEHCHVD